MKSVVLRSLLHLGPCRISVSSPCCLNINWPLWTSVPYSLFVYIHMHVHVETKGQPQLFAPRHSSPYCFEAVLHQDLGLASKARLVHLWAPAPILPLPLHCWDCKWLFTCALGITPGPHAWVESTLRTVEVLKRISLLRDFSEPLHYLHSLVVS